MSISLGFLSSRRAEEPAPCFFFLQAAPAPRSQKHPATTGSGSGSNILPVIIELHEPVPGLDQDVPENNSNNNLSIDNHHFM